MKHTNTQRLISAGLVAAAAVLSFSARASAAAVDEHEASEAHEEEAEASNVLTLKLAGLEIVVPGAEEPGPAGEEPESTEDRVLRRVGVAIGYERVLIPGWLEAELSVLFAPGGEGLTLPIDLVVKKPFEFSPSVEGFLGLGLATEWFEDGESETAYGMSSQLGAYYWTSSNFGLVFEGEYNLLLHPETAHEFVLESGAAFRF